MKRKYELNFYIPCQFADIRDHLEAMALRGWRLERMEDYFYSLASMEHVRTGLNYLKYRSFMR